MPVEPPTPKADGQHPLRLQMSGMSKRYGAVQALDAVDFELRAGEVMALLGENGAGKSTLVKVLTGLVDADDGHVRVDGEVVHLFPTSRSQAAGVAAVQQEISCIPSMSIAENLVLGDQAAGAFTSPRRLAADARALLEPVGLQHLDPRRLVEEISVAESQLVEIARVLARKAKIVIFDEPTAALSDADITRVLAMVRELARRGCGVIYVTHRLREVFEIADRVTVMRNGSSLPPIAVEDLDVDRVITLLLGRRLESMFPSREPLSGEPVLVVDRLQAAGLAEPVSFELRPGEILGLSGQIGSGANVVLRALAGTVPGVQGSATLRGRPLPLRGRHASTRAGVGYCSDDRKKDGFFAGRSTRENLSAPWLSGVARGGWVSRRRERERANAIAGSFAIDQSRLRSPVQTLSGGNQQKVVLGKWLGTDPAILLVEEPTRGVDVGARAEINHKLRELCAEGLSIVLASSDTNEVLGFCDTIATFYRGRMTDVRSHEHWTEEEMVREVMHPVGAPS